MAEKWKQYQGELRLASALRKLQQAAAEADAKAGAQADSESEADSDSEAELESEAEAEAEAEAESEVNYERLAGSAKVAKTHEGQWARDGFLGGWAFVRAEVRAT
jgi:hypothetical protein